MKVYRCIRRFFATPLKRYIPVGAHICRFEEITKIVISDAPQTDLDPFDQLADGIEYDNPHDVTWLYGVEPPPLGIDSRWFVTIASVPESACGEGVTGATGAPGPQGPVGVSASAVLTSSFVIPNLCSTGNATVSQSNGYSVGAYVIINDGSESARFVVVAVPNPTTLTLRTIESTNIGGVIDAGTFLNELGFPAYSYIDTSFTIPTIGASSVADVISSEPYSIGEFVRIDDGLFSGLFEVVGIVSNTLNLRTIESNDVGSTLAGCIPVTHSAPSGLQGDQGFQGKIGFQGDFGPQGLQSDIGVQGPIGLQGSIGGQGIQGIDGPQGVVGANGLQGSQGNVGFQGVGGAQGDTGAQGLQGDVGSRGLQGIVGSQGSVGDRGIQGNQGVAGTDGLQGVVGAQGDFGPQGLQGNIGDTGIQGSQGFQGQIGQGLQGDSGPQGIAGQDGSQGDIGFQGSTGAQGDFGPQGAEGVQGLFGSQGNQGFVGDTGS